MHVAASFDEEGREVTPQRAFGYDTLVIAVGSESNDFGTPGVEQHAMKLETQADAKRFHACMVNACIRAHARAAPLRPEQLKVAIIGAGATGVELAAELHRTTREVVAYGLDRGSQYAANDYRKKLEPRHHGVDEPQGGLLG